MKHPFKKLTTVVSAFLATFLFISTISFTSPFVGAKADSGDESIFRVYFETPASGYDDAWKKDPQIHYWGGSSESTWPGPTMTWVKDFDGKKMWRYDIPNDTTGIIFSDTQSGGARDQTSNITTNIKPGTVWYLNGGNWGSRNTGTYDNHYEISITLHKGTLGNTNGSAKIGYGDLISSGFTSKTDAKANAGYNLLGYYTSASGGTKVVNADGTICANIADFTDSTYWLNTNPSVTLYAQWSAKKYTLTYDPGTGGSVSPTSREIYYKEPFGELPTPTKSGYTFLGWYTSTASTGTLITPETLYSYSTNKTIYARWDGIVTEYTLDLDDGYIPDLSYTNIYQKVGSGSWYYNSSCSDEYAITKSSVSSPKALSPLPEKTGYTFLQFSAYKPESSRATKVIDENGYLGSVSGSDVFQNNTLYAEWKANTYTVSFDANGEPTNPDSKTVTYDSAYGTLPTPATWTGHSFLGWFTAADDSGTEVTSSTIVKTASNHTLYAHWTANANVFTLNPNGGTLPKDYTHFYQVSHKSSWFYNAACTDDYAFTNTSGGKPLPALPTRTGYTFQNFIGNYGGNVGKNVVNSSGYLVNVGGSTVFQSNVLTATWKANSYTITYNGNESTGGTMKPSSHTYDEDKTLTPNTYTRTGYTFAGWNTSADGSGTSYSDQQSVKNLTDVDGATVTLYAQWSVNSHSLTWITDGDPLGGNYTRGQVEYGTTIIQPDTPTKTGYTFAAWNPTVPQTMPDNDLTLTATWTAHTYTVEYDGNGKTSGTMSSSSHVFGISKNLFKNQYGKLGYTFTGWNTSADGSGINYTDQQSVINLTSVDGATVTLYAQWSGNQYTVSFDANCGGEIENPDPITVTNGLPYGALPDITRQTYNLAGWFTTPEGGTKIEPATIANLSGPQTLYAHWNRAIEYTLDVNGGTLPSQYNHLYELEKRGWYYKPTCGNSERVNATTPLPALPTKEGYDFDGFYGFIDGVKTQVITKRGYLEPSITTTTVFDSTTLVAEWTPITHFLRGFKSFDEKDQIDLYYFSENVYIVRNFEISSGQELKAVNYDSSKSEYVWLNPTKAYTPIPQAYEVSFTLGGNVKVDTDGIYDLYVNFADGSYSFEPVGLTVSYSVNGGQLVDMTRTDQSTYAPEDGSSARWEVSGFSASRYDVIRFYCNGVELYTSVDKGSSSLVDDRNSNGVISVWDKNKNASHLEAHNDISNQGLYFKTFDRSADTYTCWLGGRTTIGLETGENIYIKDNGGWITYKGASIGAEFEDADGNKMWAPAYATEAWYSWDYTGGNEGGHTYYEITAPTDANGQPTTWVKVTLCRCDNSKAPSSDAIWQKTEPFILDDAATDFYRAFTLVSYTDGTQSATASKNNDYNDVDRVNTYSYYFNETCEFCDDYSSHAKDLATNWSNFGSQYSAMSEHSQNLFTNAVSDPTSTDMASLERVASLYDHVVWKYNTELADEPDFAGRFADENGVSNIPEYRGHSYSLNSSEDQSILIIVIAASATLLATSAALLFVLKKKKKQISK